MVQASQLREGRECTFFFDEYRSPVAMHDVVRTVQWLATGGPGAHEMHGRVCNMGGPERLSRLDMAHAVATECGLSTACVTSAPAASVQRAAASPLDISMDSSRLQSALPFAMTPFAKGLAAALACETKTC